MRYFVVFLFLCLSINSFAQAESSQKVSGTIVNDNTKLPVPNVNIINLNKSRGTISNEKGYFEIEVNVNDTIYVSFIGFQSLKIRVTNDWVKNKTTNIQLTEKAIALEEIILGQYNLTGYLEVDSKLIPSRESYRYSISGLQQGYEAGEYSPNAFGRTMNSISNPADMLYNFFGKKPKELKRLKAMKKDPNVRNLMQSKYDRESLAVMLGVDKQELGEILSHCNYSDSFANTATDLQVLDAISECYEEYKILKKK
jgi:hypothetical protein